jgi:hypothetical protein
MQDEPEGRATQRPFQELLQYFAMERFLYRLSKSPFADRFTLKGALLMTAWRASFSRPTVDIELVLRPLKRVPCVAELMTGCSAVELPVNFWSGRDSSGDSTPVSPGAGC